MTEVAPDELLVAVTPAGIRAALHDPALLARVLPDCEAVEAVGPDRLRLVLAARVGFLTIRADVDARVVEPDERSLRLELDGRARGLDGGFRATIPFDLEPLPGGATRVRWRAEVETSGTLALAGSASVAGALRALAGELVANLERELPGGT